MKSNDWHTTPGMRWTSDPNHIMPTAIIHASATIGEGTLVGHFALIREGARIGRNCKIGSYTEVGPGAHIEDGAWVHSRCFIVEGAYIGPDAFLGPGVILCNARYPRSPRAKQELLPPSIGGNAVIGAGTIIMPGVVVASHATVGAGSLVLQDVMEGAVAYGNPARVRSRHRPEAYVESAPHRPPGSVPFD